MRYAYKNNIKKEVSYSGETAVCPCCNSAVIGKKGEINTKHWAHKSIKDCDKWYEPITEWHLKWQNEFPEDYREVIMKDNNDKIVHRADIRLRNGLVIEIQNSPISPNEIYAREKFYGVNNMIWILNGENLAKNSIIKYSFEEKEFSINIEIPNDSINISEYDMDIFRMKLYEQDYIKKLELKKQCISFKESNGYYLKYDFSKSIDFRKITSHLKYLIKDICIELYGYNIYKKLQDHINVSFIDIPKDSYFEINLQKKYWRKFIDKMSFPVFIDNINGLEKDLIYWYQENKIFKRSKLIEKYLKYT